jgi:phenolic acid decarboxylase
MPVIHSLCGIQGQNEIIQHKISMAKQNDFLELVVTQREHYETFIKPATDTANKITNNQNDAEYEINEL